MTTNNTTEKRGGNLAILNGNKFVKTEHVFVVGDGCYFATEQEAINQGTSSNGVGLWTKTLEFDGKTWFQAGNTNCFD